MFTRSGVSQSVVDAVSSILKEEEKKKMLLEPEKKKAEVAENTEKKSSNPFDVLKGTYKSQLSKQPGELTGHEHKKTTTGNVFMKKFKKDKVEEQFTEDQLDEMIAETLSKDASAGDWIHDFVHSDNPKFKGKSKAQRKKQALAAYYAKQHNEEVQLGEEDKWIQKAIKHPGAETAAAHRAGKSVQAYAQSHKHDSGTAGKRARLAITLGKMHHEEVEQLDELGGISTMADEALVPGVQTNDTLRGREPGARVNKHTSSKVKLKAEEAHDDEKEDKALVKKMVKPTALKKEEHSPMSLAKDLAKKSFKKIRQETMMGKAGATSEEKKHD